MGRFLSTDSWTRRSTIPRFGYYRRADRDPFGKDGDFFTAEQLQPVFGILIAAGSGRCSGNGRAADFTVVELAPGGVR
jgi:SAM-dependent MidA family methyltransferase